MTFIIKWIILIYVIKIAWEFCLLAVLLTTLPRGTKFERKFMKNTSKILALVLVLMTVLMSLSAITASAAAAKVVMDKLKDVDQVAYVRFASVYRKFKDVDEFIEEIRALR